ncbi:MAG: hypothetical protein SPE37_00950 [Campylobacter sp.]|nr:hypothetical protein [Campylobacter sp.]
MISALWNSKILCDVIERTLKMFFIGLCAGMFVGVLVGIWFYYLS